MAIPNDLIKDTSKGNLVSSVIYKKGQPEPTNTNEKQQKLFLSCLIQGVSRFKRENIISLYKNTCPSFWLDFVGVYAHMLADAFTVGFSKDICLQHGGEDMAHQCYDDKGNIFCFRESFSIRTEQLFQ